MARIIKHQLDIVLILIAMVSFAALFLAHEDPFVRDAFCKWVSSCPTIENAKAWNKIFYDLECGAAFAQAVLGEDTP